MKKFLQQLAAIVATLGFSQKFQNKELTAEEQSAIVDAYNKQYGENAFEADHKAFEDDQKKAAEDAARKAAFEQLAGVLGVEAPKAGAADNSSAVVDAVKDLKATVEKLGASSQGDAPTDKVQMTIAAYGAHTDKYAFGVRHSMFDASKRWNRIAVTREIAGDASIAEKEAFQAEFSAYCEGLQARINELHKSGSLKNLKPEAAITVSGLNSDNEIGTRQFTIRQDMLIARISALPTLDGIFSKISNVQSGQVITNVLFGAISQAYQAGRVFKGSVDFAPEKAKVDKVMAKVQFSDMSALELSYLNYLNTNGSDPVKWSLIEWFVLHIATVISNEKVERAIRGRYVTPTSNVAGLTMLASTGIIGRLLSYYDDKKMLPFTSSSCDGYSSSDIGDVLVYFASQIAERVKNPLDYVIYVNEKHKPLFIHWFENKYGTYNNFNGAVVDVVPEYGNRIKWVPGMGNLQIIFSSVEGNIALLENVPGEEYKMQFQRDLEEIIAFSYWKEGVGAGYVGKTFSSASDLAADDAKHQMVFMNWPAATVAADATTLDADDAKAGNIFQLPNTNTADKALTDITHAVDGETYRIVGPATVGTYKTTIAKSGKFSNLSAAVNFNSDKYLDVAYDATNSKFIEVGRG